MKLMKMLRHSRLAMSGVMGFMAIIAVVPEGAAQVAQQSPVPTPGRWRNVTSPQGRFSVELPEGWDVKPKEPDETSVSFGPAGRDFPAVGVIGWWTAETLQMMRTRQPDPRLSCRQVSAQELYAQILLPLVRQATPDVKIEHMVPNQPTARARVEGSLTYQGQPSRFLDVVSMEYLADPTLALVAGCPQPWQSFAFIGSLMASPKEFGSLVPVAERIFSTFTPNPRWGAEVREIFFRGMETRLAMIGQTMSRISRMDMEQQMREMQSSRRTNQGWIDTLGGVYRYKDPQDPSYEGTIPMSKIPSRPTRLWRCGFQREPIFSDTSPGAGCAEIPALR